MLETRKTVATAEPFVTYHIDVMTAFITLVCDLFKYLHHFWCHCTFTSICLYIICQLARKLTSFEWICMKL